MLGWHIRRERKEVYRDNWHEYLVPGLAAVIRPAVYVEIGIYEGVTFRAVAQYSQKAIAVDINPNCEKFVDGPEASFLCGTSQDIGLHRWVINQNPIDLAFVDGDHSFESVRQDFLNLTPYLSRQAVVLFHDTYPSDRASTSPSLCGDAYRFPAWCRQYDNGAWSVVTLPRHPGLTIVTRADVPLPWQNP